MIEKRERRLVMFVAVALMLSGAPTLAAEDTEWFVEELIPLYVISPV